MTGEVSLLGGEHNNYRRTATALASPLRPTELLVIPKSTFDTFFADTKKAPKSRRHRRRSTAAEEAGAPARGPFRTAHARLIAGAAQYRREDRRRHAWLDEWIDTGRCGATSATVSSSRKGAGGGAGGFGGDPAFSNWGTSTAQSDEEDAVLVDYVASTVPWFFFKQPKGNGSDDDASESYEKAEDDMSKKEASSTTTIETAADDCDVSNSSLSERGGTSSRSPTAVSKTTSTAAAGRRLKPSPPPARKAAPRQRPSRAAGSSSGRRVQLLPSVCGLRTPTDDRAAKQTPKSKTTSKAKISAETLPSLHPGQRAGDRGKLAVVLHLEHTLVYVFRDRRYDIRVRCLQRTSFLAIAN